MGQKSPREGQRLPNHICPLISPVRENSIEESALRAFFESEGYLLEALLEKMRNQINSEEMEDESCVPCVELGTVDDYCISCPRLVKTLVGFSLLNHPDLPVSMLQLQFSL